jgi:hypothetical protein
VNKLKTDPLIVFDNSMAPNCYIWQKFAGDRIVKYNVVAETRLIVKA